MNFVSHCLVSTRAFPAENPTQLSIGASLPDIASVAGIPVSNFTELAPTVRLGIETHHAADAAFHSHPLFVNLCSRIGSSLQSLAVRRGPARACAHVGIELALDGRSVYQLGADVNVKAILDGLGALDNDLASEDRARLQIAVAGFKERIASSTYESPEAISLRLGELLTRRPRLALNHTEADAVKHVLSNHWNEILNDHEDIINDVTANLEARQEWEMQKVASGSFL